MPNQNNRVRLSGNLSSDAELKTVGANNLELIQFSIAVSGAGSEKGAAGFFQVTFWLAENDYVATADIRRVRELFDGGHLTKGKRATIEGSIRTWEAKDDSKSRGINIVGDSIDMYVAATASGYANTGNATSTATTESASAHIPNQF